MNPVEFPTRESSPLLDRVSPHAATPGSVSAFSDPKPGEPFDSPRLHDQASRRTPRHTTYFEDLSTALRLWAQGLFRDEAAVELLIGHVLWLGREDFLGLAVEFGRGVGDGPLRAAVDWEAAVAGLDGGRLPCSGSEAQILRLAASLAGGVRLDLGSALSGLDERNAALVAGAVVRAAGHRGVGLSVAVGGERQ